MKTVEFRISDLIPYEWNTKIHTEEQINRIANSIKEFGFTQPVVVDKTNIVIIGHARILAAKKLGMKKIPVVKIEDLTDIQVKKLRILDNKLNESERNLENLKLELESLDYDLSIGDMELKAEDLFDLELLDVDENKEIQEDNIPEIKEVKVIKESDLFFLGNHRLLCGDSTKSEDTEKLMDGQHADLLLIDPPYNVDYNSKGKKILNDNMDQNLFYQFLFSAFNNARNNMKDGASFYVRYASREVINFRTALENARLPVKQELIWSKDHHVLGRQDYQRKHEPCLYGRKDTGPHKWYGGRTESTVINWNKPTNSEEHPTMKPVGLFDYLIKNSTKKSDLVLDLFGGSGTTLIACEQNGRRCNMMELDPKYCEVIIRRFHKLNPEAEIRCLNRDLDLKPILDD